MLHFLSRRTRVVLVVSGLLASLAGCSSYNYNPRIGGWGAPGNVWVHGNNWGHNNTLVVARGGYYHPGRW